MTFPGSGRLPDFRLEVHFAEWEHKAQHHLTASDAESITVAELLEVTGTDPDVLLSTRLGYAPVEGSEELRAAVAGTYERLDPDDVLCFAGAEEAIFWVARTLLGPGTRAVVGVPGYQSSETLAELSGAEVVGLPLWTGSGDDLRWTLDLDRVDALLPADVLAVSLPNNPTGFLPSPADFARLAERCDETGTRLVSDEVYRGLELDPARRLPQAADLSERAVSVGVMSKSYGLPGLRVGWVACRDRALLAELARGKHWTSICNAVPSELLAAAALRSADSLQARNRAIIAANLPVFDAFFAERPDRFTWQPPDGGCVAFPRYAGSDGVEAFCRRALHDAGVLLLPASPYATPLASVPDDRFRIGVGRRDPGPALEVLRGVLG